MIIVHYEEYWNDYKRHECTKEFETLDNVTEWMFGMMRREYKGDVLAMYFPKEAGKGAISLNPRYNSPEIWIHQINSCGGIIFSDGRKTAGQTYMAKRVQEWLTRCVERRDNPVFNFVE